VTKPEAYVTTTRMAEILAVTPKTLKRWIRDGAIGSECYIHVMETYRFLPSATLACLHNATRQPPQSTDGQITEQLELPFEYNTDGGANHG